MSEEKIHLLWKMVSKPPKEALKTIRAGRIKGMTDVNPQYRYKIMTETYGMCGIGWKWEVTDRWKENIGEEIHVFVDVNLYIKVDGEWSEPIPGTGGNKLLTKESKGLYASDEAFKMATTDALSTALKMVGVASEIYEGNWDGSKYRDEEPLMTKDQALYIKNVCAKEGFNPKEFTEAFGISSKETTEKHADNFIKNIDSKIKQFVGEPE